MSKILQTLPDEIIADYIDGSLSEIEHKLFEEVISVNREIREYVEKVTFGRKMLKMLSRDHSLSRKAFPVRCEIRNRTNQISR